MIEVEADGHVNIAFRNETRDRLINNSRISLRTIAVKTALCMNARM